MSSTLVTSRIIDVLCAHSDEKITTEDNGNVIAIDHVVVDSESTNETDLKIDMICASKKLPGTETVLKYGGNLIVVVAGWQGEWK